MVTSRPEQQFVRLAARAALGEPVAAELSSINGHLHWPEVVEEAAVQRLGALALEALAEVPAIDESETATRERHDRIVSATVNNLAALSSLRAGLGALDAAGIRAAAAATPGAVLMLASIKGYELRTPTVLVAPADAERARATLAAIGTIAVETSAGGDRAHTDGAIEDILARAADASVCGCRLRVLAPIDRLIALCARAASHGWNPLEYVVAAAALMREPIAWEATRDAAGPRLSRTILTTARVVRDTLGIESTLAAVADRERAAHRPAHGTNGREIWIAGFPSLYGGADTELDHQIDLLRQHGVTVHLVPMFGADPQTTTSVLERGCEIHEYRDDIFRDKVVASFCNGEFLAALPAIMRAGRPAKVVWFNCMTWTFEREREAHERGWIDVFGFQSEYQRRLLTSLLEPIGPVRSFPYRPYFNPVRVAWSYREWRDGTYRLGRISRDDGAKFAADTWRIFERVLAPPHLKKQVFILGYGPNAERQIGPAPPTIDWRTWAPGEIPAVDFYRTIDTMVHKTGGSRESYCRVLIEAYAHGVVPIVEHDYAFPELVVHGETGFMTSDSDEMSYYASYLAMNPGEHRRLAENGRRHLEHTLAEPERCWDGWQEIFAP